MRTIFHLKKTTGGADRNPRHLGEFGPQKPTLRGGFEPRPDFLGGAEKVVVHMHPLESRLAPLNIFKFWWDAEPKVFATTQNQYHNMRMKFP